MTFGNGSIFKGSLTGPPGLSSGKTQSDNMEDNMETTCNIQANKYRVFTLLTYYLLPPLYKFLCPASKY